MDLVTTDVNRVKNVCCVTLRFSSPSELTILPSSGILQDPSRTPNEKDRKVVVFSKYEGMTHPTYEEPRIESSGAGPKTQGITVSNPELPKEP